MDLVCPVYGCRHYEDDLSTEGNLRIHLEARHQRSVRKNGLDQLVKWALQERGPSSPKEAV